MRRIEEPGANSFFSAVAAPSQCRTDHLAACHTGRSLFVTEIYCNCNEKLKIKIWCGE